MKSTSAHDSHVDALFVYGTLLRGEGLHGHIERLRGIRGIHPARTRGRLYDMGSWPGMRQDGEAADEDAWVLGECICFDDVGPALAILDRVEGYRGPGVPGSLFERVITCVETDDGLSLPAWTYLVVALDGASPIPGGDWRAHRRERGGGSPPGARET